MQTFFDLDHAKLPMSLAFRDSTHGYSILCNGIEPVTLGVSGDVVYFTTDNAPSHAATTASLLLNPYTKNAGRAINSVRGLRGCATIAEMLYTQPWDVDRDRLATFDKLFDFRARDDAQRQPLHPALLGMDSVVYAEFQARKYMGDGRTRLVTFHLQALFLVGCE